MRYFVTVDGQTFQVELDGSGVSCNGQALDIQLSAVPGTVVRRLAVAGRSYVVHVASSAGRGAWDIHLDGERYLASVVDERTQAIQALTATTNLAQGPKPVKAPMPGLIVRVHVQPGDTVHAGQGVLLIEAMKMENELRAEAGGRVKAVHAQPGQPVEKGTVLIEFDEGQGS
ncbi:MAG: biotin/lipoyl-containing protein [Longimicrobiales bacterium]